jgi:type VI secretion system protein ImpE
MTARELFESGRLREAIEEQTASVKANPSDIDGRYALSVFLCYAGDLDRAFMQLNTIGKLNSDLAMGTHVYRSLLIADMQRRKVYTEDAKPLLPPDCPDSVEARLEALQAMRRGDLAAAGSALDRAAEGDEMCSGKLNGNSIDGARDADDILGSVLEIFAGETYVWVPFKSIRKLTTEPPTSVLDLIYLPAQLEDVNGSESSVYLPTLYEGSHLAEDGKIQTGQVTEWVEVDQVGHRGIGQKVLLTACGDTTEEVGLLDLRSLEFEAATSGESTGG